jgi:hypothetical protein
VNTPATGGAETPATPTGSKTALLALRVLLGVPVIATPLLWFGALFALLAHGITPIQQLHVLAIVAYPVVYVIGFVNSRRYSRKDDFRSATSVMMKVLFYLAAVIVSWPVIGFR